MLHRVHNIYMYIWCIIYYISCSLHLILHAMNIVYMIHGVFDVTSYIYIYIEYMLYSLYHKNIALIS